MISGEALEAEMQNPERWPDGMATFADAAALLRGLEAALAAFDALGECAGRDLYRQLQVLEGVVEAIGYISVGIGDFPASVTPAALLENLNLEQAFAKGRARAQRECDDTDDLAMAWMELSDANDNEVPEERRRLLAVVEGLKLQKLPLAFIDVFAEALAWGYYSTSETIGCLQELVRLRASARASRGGFRLVLPELGRIVDLGMSPQRCVDEIRGAIGAA